VSKLLVNNSLAKYVEER